MKKISAILSLIALLLIIWDIFNTDVMILYTVIYGLLAASFLLSGVADSKEGNKSTAYLSFLASLVLLVLFATYTLGSF